MEHHAGTWLNAIVHAEPEWLKHYLTANSLSAMVVGLILFALGFVATRNMKMRPTSGLQAVVEWLYTALVDFCKDTIGPHGEKDAPFLGTIFTFVFVANVLGVVPGFISPTSSLTTTAALAIVTIIYVQLAGFREHGVKYLMHFVGEPWWLFPLNIPIHVVGDIAKPLSLSVRLFGNIFGEDAVIAQLMLMGAGIYAATYIPVPVHLPMILFHIFISFVQALVFFMLSTSYIAQATAGHDEKEPEGEHASETAQQAA